MPLIFPTLNAVAHDYLGEANGAPALATFARASSASRVNALGVLEDLAGDALRHDYDPATGAYRGWRIEGERTNLLLHSEAFDDPWWEKLNATVTPNLIAAPDGAPTADKLVEDTTNAVHRVRRLNALTAGVTYTGSVFARPAERSTLQVILGFGGVFGATQSVNFDLAAGTAAVASGAPGFGIEPLQDGWHRCWVRQTASATGNTNFTLALNDGATYTGDGASGLYLWGAQVEAGGHASSYIKTDTTQATRTADRLTIPLGAFPYNSREGTLVAAVSLERVPASSAEADRQHALELFGTGNEGRWFFREDGLAFVGRRDGGAFSSADDRLVVPGLAAKAVYRCAVAFTREEFVIGVDGRLSEVFTRPLGVANATELRIGWEGAGRELDGHVRHLAYFPRRLEDEVLRQVVR